MSEPDAAGESTPAADESDAFISYSHLDREFAVVLRDALRAAGKRPWLDETELRGGTRWSAALQRAIEHADAFVFLLTPQSAGSPECRRELDYALRLNKRILPLRIADTPRKTLPPRLAEYQFIPSRELFGTDFAGSTRLLITEIETDRDWVREHTESVYQFGSSTPFLTLVGNTAAIGDVAFSPDSQLIETTDGFQVSVYDTRNAQPLLTFPVRNGSEASAVGSSADGRSLIADTAFPYETYPCSICGGFDQLLSAAREREVGPLTPQERDLYLH